MFASTSAARDRRFLAATRGLLATMLDSDLGMALRDPMQISNQFTAAYTRANVTRQDHELGLFSPFLFISAEHIANDQLLVAIFAKTCPWLEKVAGPDPCLVTGPRGCGKSTIFRWLSLKAHLHKPFADVADTRIAGFYLSCSIDLQNRLSWIKSQAMAERFRADIVHYFNLLAAREIVNTLALIAERQDREVSFGFGPSEEVAIHRFLLDALAPSAATRLQGSSRLAQAREAVEREMFAAHAQMLRGLNRSNVTPESFLGDLTQLMVARIPFFAQKRIAFLLDDFSVHRLPEAVQIILNRIIWERRPSHVFKLSCEKYGAVLTDSFQATADVTREMKEIDCGREYAKAPFRGPDHLLQYLARYTHRVAISNHRLLSFDGESVTFRWKDYAHGNKKRKMTISADEFLRRFLLHTLPRGFVRIRFFGFMAGPRRSRMLQLARRLLETGVECGVPPYGPDAHVLPVPGLRHPDDLHRAAHGGDGQARSRRSPGCDSRLIVAAAGSWRESNGLRPVRHMCVDRK